MTSYPRDFGDDVLDVMAACPRICRYLHAPAQSGSNRILKLMNRGYTVEDYRDFADRALAKLPDLALAGDIIVGFPTETDEDFAATVELVRSLPFKNNFIFKYSPRPGTSAIDRFPDDVPVDVKKYRNNALLAVQNEVSARVHHAWIGRTVDVLIEGISHASQTDELNERRRVSAPNQTMIELRLPRSTARETSPPIVRQLVGRTSGDLITFFNCPTGMEPHEAAGRILPVQVTEAGPLFLKGHLQAH